MGTQMRDAVTQLNFEEEPPINIWDAVSRLLMHFGDQGATLEDLAGLFQKSNIQWKTNSISPAL